MSPSFKVIRSTIFYGRNIKGSKISDVVVYSLTYIWKEKGLMNGKSILNEPTVEKYVRGFINPEIVFKSIF